MGRHRQLDRPTEKKLSLRSSVVEQTEGSLIDPLTKKPAYGSFAVLVEQLLEGWLDGRFKVSIEPYRMDMGDLLDEKEEEAKAKRPPNLTPPT